MGRDEEVRTRVLDRIRLLDGRRISGAELGSLTGVSDVTVRHHVKQLRLMGHPIAGRDIDGGYWLARTPDELGPTIEKFRSLIASHAAIISALEDTRRDLCKEKMGDLFV
jgi:biotin operon repressor